VFQDWDFGFEVLKFDILLVRDRLKEEFGNTHVDQTPHERELAHAVEIAGRRDISAFAVKICVKINERFVSLINVRHAGRMSSELNEPNNHSISVKNRDHA
jgi:hypothetical protein